MTIENLKEAQKEVIQILNNSYLKNKLVHAYIFNGTKGSGVVDAAQYFGAMLLCESEVKPCLKCNTCTRIFANEHTNIQIIEPIDGTIKKEQITGLIHEFSMSGLEDGPRIYIINNAEKMNASASNALLKFLEEPVNNRYAILITSNYKILLDTIVSRCQVINFKQLNKNILIDELEKKGIEKDTSYILSSITSNIDIAQTMINEGKILDLIDIAKKINEDRNKNKSMYISFYTLINNKDSIFKQLSKEMHSIFISILMLICEERIKYINGEEKYYFKQIASKTSKRKNTINSLIHELEIYSNYQERINSHVNIDLQYASMFIEIEQEVK